MNKILRLILEGPWTYWVGAVVLAILNILVLIVRQQPWGITQNIEFWAKWLGSTVGLLDNPGITFNQLILASGTYLNLGVILGAFWASLVASQVRFRSVRDRKYVISALAGGLLIGYGARIAYGCSIGLILNSIASSSLTGWIFMISVFIGTWFGSKILLRFLI